MANALNFYLYQPFARAGLLTVPALYQLFARGGLLTVPAVANVVKGTSIHLSLGQKSALKHTISK